jgi:hypothetical protein
VTETKRLLDLWWVEIELLQSELMHRRAGVLGSSARLRDPTSFMTNDNAPTSYVGWLSCLKGVPESFV